jgi:2-polyprenyl-3-methyl-5-hydroxy-6-metoxy-1,4-benzoquinol methylase
MSSLQRYTSEVSEYRLPILARVPAGATVLDVGPWTGAHGRHLVQHAGATVDGVETDAEAAAVASADYREVIVGPVDDEAIQARLAGRGYDTILFLDVLEHLRDPAAVLRAAREWLSPGGTVLCSLPNVAHWRVRLALARGRFDYADNGLMDRTHLRWFTRDSARELVAGAGYAVTWEGAAVPQHPRVRVPQKLLRPELFAYQLYYEGRPRD